MATPTSYPHPYYPTGLSIHGYTIPTHSLPVIAILFGATAFSIFTGGYLLTRHLNPLSSRTSCLSASWFLFCGLLHINFEGFFIRHRHTLASSTHVLASAWKHYALSDSRYLANDGFVVGIEMLTVLIQGPLCLVVFAGGAFGKWWLHPLRIVVCAIHFWSCALYFVTEAKRGHRDCRPEALYWWGYFVGMNLPWIVVPVVLVVRSVGIVGAAMRKAEKMELKTKRKLF